MRRFASGTTDQYVYFQRQTGLNSFTVYRSRNGAAWTQMTTPTLSEGDATNAPGIYELLLDEDMTIGAGNLAEQMAFYVTHAGMNPVFLEVELYDSAAAGIPPTVGEIADAVWDEAIAGHLGAGSTGEALDNAGAAGTPPTAAEVADAVWDEAQAGHVGAGSFGEIATEIAAILVDTGTTLDGKIDTIDGIVDSILVDTAEIGAAGAGLTAINLPDQTMNITGNITGNLSGSVGSVTAGVTVTTNNDKTGYRLSATGVDDIHDEVIEGTYTLRQSLRLANSALGGKASGLATATAVYRDVADTKDRITATVDSDGNRSAVTLDVT